MASVKNPFDQLGKITIPVPREMFSGFKLSQVREFAAHYSISVAKDKNSVDYLLSTDDAKNIFWFGCNVNNHHLPSPSALSQFVQLGAVN